ncbi:hypothetical protein D3C81_2132540 [compost metagenome]
MGLAGSGNNDQRVTVALILSRRADRVHEVLGVFVAGQALHIPVLEFLQDPVMSGNDHNIRMHLGQ